MNQRLKPNYFVIGAAKSASSTICTLLGQHPDVFMVDCKEPCYFNDDGNYFGRGIDWYESLYVDSECFSRRGEGSNNYTMKELWPDTAERIFAEAPSAKLIYVVRHPLRRIESWWMQKIANGSRETHFDFNLAIQERPDIFIHSTNYLAQLEPYFQRFSEDQIQIVFFEDFKKDPAMVMRQIFSFLEVDPDRIDNASHQHLNPSEGKIVYSSLLIRIRRAGWLKPLKKLLSDGAKQRMADRFFRRVQDGRPEWSALTKQLVQDSLARDSRALCQKYGKPADFWNLSE